jgi:hypothetical protein
MSRKISKPRQCEAKKFVYESLQQLEEIAKEKFGKYPVSPKIRISFHKRFEQSSAGDNSIFFALHKAMFNKIFWEYVHIEKDKEIGTLRTKDWREHVATIVAHEYAHLVDELEIETPKTHFSYCDKCLTADEWGHGASWQYIYRVLRTELLRKI